MLLEPPGPDVPARRPEVGDLLTSPVWRRAAAAAAGVVAATSAGDVFVLAGLLVLSSGEVAAGLTAGLVAVGAVLRFGSTSLSALAGAQAVLGPAGLVGPPAAAASSWAGAASLAAAAPPGWAGVGFGLAAAAVIGGPAPRTPADVAVRAAAAAAAVGLAVARARWLPRWVAWAGLAGGVACVALVVPG